MRVGILTFPNSNSFGAALQMFALYKVIYNNGNDVEIINYHNEFMKSNSHCAKAHIQNRAQWSVKQKITQILHYRQKAGFHSFERKMARYPSLPVSNKIQLRKISHRYDAIVCGSDQVWNPDITGYDLSYFLDFGEAYLKRIAYAPSFGVEKLSEDYGVLVGQELKKFSSLSIREETGKNLIKEISGMDAQLVVDPTMLMDGDEWKQIEKVHPAARGEYILYYTIRSSESLWKYCLKLAEKNDLKILRIGGNRVTKYFKNKENIEYVCDVNPAEWLYLVHNAKYVVTNSFHGTAFSIIYRKNFFVEFSSLTNSRLSHIVTMLGLENQVVTHEKTDYTVNTDYGYTEKILPIIRESSLQYLLSALKETTVEYEKN